MTEQAVGYATLNFAPPASPLVENPLAFMARPTPQMKSVVAHYQETLPPVEFLDFVAIVRSAFEKYTAKLLEFEPGADRGRALHDMMERELKVAEFIPVSCCRGCSGCCHYEVEITENEAAVLRDAVLNGLAIDHQRLALQAARERQSAEWKGFRGPNNRCVFLSEEGACRVYEDRPAICRKHLVTTPASACTTEGAHVAPIKILLAEILLSAELSIEGTQFASLPKLLWRSLQEAGVAQPTWFQAVPSGRA